MAIVRHATPLVASPWPAAKAILLFSSIFIPIFTSISASRAYPHGCLYRHPSYYTYDERDDISWAIMPSYEEINLDGDVRNDKDYQLENNPIQSESAEDLPTAAVFTDFRKLPPRSSRLRRPYDRYRLTRRLGAGKFSDVFEAVDNQWEENDDDDDDAVSVVNQIGIEEKYCNKQKRKKRIREGGEDSSSYSSTSNDGETSSSTDVEDDPEADDAIDTNSLVVLKCLKPVSERKIRRELLVLTHCATLPNLARVIGIVLPDSMDKSEDEDVENEKQQQQASTTQSSSSHSKKRRRQERLQRENIGSITDATTAAASVAARAKHNGNAPNKSNKHNDGKAQNKKHDGTQLPALVLEHAGQHAQWLCHGQQHQNLQQQTNGSNGNAHRHLSEYEMKYYLCHLLIALDGLHAAGIMHRDVKPRNTLINRFLFDKGSDTRSSSRNRSEAIDIHSHSHYETLQQHQSTKQSQLPLPPPPLMLVDLGLADFYLPGKEYNVRVASRHYKSPELLIGFEYYDYAIDMWSVGCILAGLLFRREPFFRGKDNEDQLGKIVSVLGTRDFLPYCRKCNVRLSSKARAAIGKYCSRAAPSSSEGEEPSSLRNNDMGKRKPWLSFLVPSVPIPSSEALDLLDKLLVYDHEQRWTAREALGHSFFDDVREKVLREVQQRIGWESTWRPVSMQRR